MNTLKLKKIMKDEMIVKQDFQWDKLMDIIEAGIKIPKVIKVKESNKTPKNFGKALNRRKW